MTSLISVQTEKLEFQKKETDIQMAAQKKDFDTKMAAQKSETELIT